MFSPTCCSRKEKKEGGWDRRRAVDVLSQGEGVGGKKEIDGIRRFTVRTERKVESKKEATFPAMLLSLEAIEKKKKGRKLPSSRAYYSHGGGKKKRGNKRTTEYSTLPKRKGNERSKRELRCFIEERKRGGF